MYTALLCGTCGITSSYRGNLNTQLNLCAAENGATDRPDHHRFDLDVVTHIYALQLVPCPRLWLLWSPETRCCFRDTVCTFMIASYQSKVRFRKNSDQQVPEARIKY